MILEKLNETRSWATKHRGELGIHANKKVDKQICAVEKNPSYPPAIQQLMKEKTLSKETLTAQPNTSITLYGI